MEALKCGSAYIALPTVHDTYRGVRELAHRKAQEDVIGVFPTIKLTNITEDALQAVEASWVSQLRHPRSRSWNWRRFVERTYSNPKQFQLAIWNQRVKADNIYADPTYADLHALAIGRTTSHRRTVQVDYVESFPYERNPFKGSVLPLVERAMTYYAFFIEANRLRIVNALPEVVPYYQSRGFVIENPSQRGHNLIKVL